ncbi:MAG: acyl-CoA dehydrogenase family protein [Leptospiraceae bacterium]|nr:acyl-CoA dehydrogenase family protein [Leptospiraceae bacterium]MDW7975638.1 acyl-CoA dehydrogenase family protein [Leptospiraceae bacterium]
MIVSNYFSDNEDLQLNFEYIVDWEILVQEYENQFEDAKKYKETKDERFATAPDSLEAAIDYYRTVLDAYGEISGKEVAPRAKAIDEKGLIFDKGKVIFPQEMIEALEIIKEAGILPYSTLRENGGLGLPASVQMMIAEIISRADASVAVCLGCVNLGETIESFGSEEQIKKWVPLMTKGEYWGAMALTEPNHGSDLQRIQTKAVKGEDGKWYITGTKRFITHGCGFADKPAIILTLARTGTPESGGKGLSFFIVDGRHVEIAKIEKKLGLHGSPTCEVVYENVPAELIGEEGKGLIKYAIQMMNGARLSVAAQALGIAEAAYRESKKYASERIQFGKPIEQIPAVKRMLENMEMEIVAMRSLLMEASKTVDMYHWRKNRMHRSKTPEREIRKDPHIYKWEKLADLFTPLSKFYNSEMANKIAYNAIQVFGGSGYIEEYDVARIYRDARITNIYEGTTQLQVVAAIGNILSGMQEKGILKEYIDSELQNFPPSEKLIQLLRLFEDIVGHYRNIEDKEIKDGFAIEVVESGARFLASLLIERSIARLNGKVSLDVIFKRKEISNKYLNESIAILSGNLQRILLLTETERKEVLTH